MTRHQSTRIFPVHIDPQVWEQWELKIYHAETRGKVLLLETQRGKKCLKIMKKPELEINQMFLILEHLAERNFKNIPRFIRTRFGDPYAKVGSSFYCLSDWLPGRHLNMYSRQEVVQAANRLAVMHLASRGFLPPGAVSDSVVFQNRLGQLRRIAIKLAELKLFFGENPALQKKLHSITIQAVESCRRLEQAGYPVLCRKAEQVAGFCHGAYNEHHILISEKEEVFITGFDKWNRDLWLIDLAGFIQQAGRENFWDHRIITGIISSYDHEYVIHPAEWEVVRAYLSFPFECWEGLKTAARRGLGQKELVELLKSCCRQEEHKIACLEKIDG